MLQAVCGGLATAAAPGSANAVVSRDLRIQGDLCRGTDKNYCGSPPGLSQTSGRAGLMTSTMHCTGGPVFPQDGASPSIGMSGAEAGFPAGAQSVSGCRAALL